MGLTWLTGPVRSTKGGEMMRTTTDADDEDDDGLGERGCRARTLPNLEVLGGAVVTWPVSKTCTPTLGCM